MRHIEWEIETFPNQWGKLRCNEVLDRQTLVHIIGDVDCPSGVDINSFKATMNEVAETLDVVPYFKLGTGETAHRIFKYSDGIVHCSQCNEEIHSVYQRFCGYCGAFLHPTK